MKIIHAAMDDSETVRKITQETIRTVYPGYYPAGAVEFFCRHHSGERIKADIASGKTYLLCDDGVIAGTVTVGGNEISRLFVLPQYQHRGYGRALLDFAERKILREYDTVRLDASFPAKQIYRKRGYRETDYHTIRTENGDRLCYDVMELRKGTGTNSAPETERLFLREMDTDDYAALYAVLADSDNMQHYPYAFDEKRVREWIERNINRYKENGFGLWAVCLIETGEVIGDCGLTLQEIKGGMLPEIGYHIRRDCQRRGYAREAAKAVRNWAFRNTDYPALYSYCKYTNAASIRTAESIGMHFDLEYPDEANGITHVSVISREDWLNELMKEQENGN